MNCAGCGQELPVRAGRGRPARFHNATCRQRARRARLASRHHDLLTAVAELEAATSELRRVLLAGGSPADTVRRVVGASAAVREQLPAAATDSTPAVTESVTKSAQAPATVESTAKRSTGTALRSAPPAARPRRSVTKPVARRRRSPRIDPETVRVQRNPDDYGPTWRVVAGEDASPILLGWVEAARTVTGNRNTSRWIITTHDLMRLDRRARNRTEAVGVLLDAYLRAAARS